MSQGFRKNKRGNQFSDTTGISPIQRGGQQRNAQRTEQISQLHQQFEDLKRKIKQVENKNQKIIQRIHKAYNFKKKSGFTQQMVHETSPVIHYDNRMQAYSNAMSLQSKSNNSDHSHQEIRWEKRVSQAPRKKSLKNQQFNYSVEYGKNQMLDDNDNIAVRHRHPGITTQTNYYNPNLNNYHSISSTTMMPPKGPQQSSYAHSVKSSKNSVLSQQLALQKRKVQDLQNFLSQKQSQLSKLYALQRKFQYQQKMTKSMIQNSFQEFFENTIVKKMGEIEKIHKKFDQKLKNLRRSTIMTKDKQQDRVSSRLIQQGRRRRSNSRSLSRSRVHSPLRGSRAKQQKKQYQGSRKSLSRSKIAEQQQKNKEFQQIADKYEQLVKIKSQENDKLETKYKQKQRQCYQLKMRVDLLQRKLSQQEKNNSQIKQSSSQIGSFGELPNKKSVQSNLLQGIPSTPTTSNEVQQFLKEKIETLERAVNEKSAQIATLTAKIQNLNSKLQTSESKNKIIHQQYQQNLTKLKAKTLEDHQNKVKQFQNNLNLRVNQIKKLTAQLSQQENKVLNKQCENYTLNNKNKKLQGLLQNKEKKISQLQKLLLVTNTGNNMLSTSNSANQDLLLSQSGGAQSQNAEAQNAIKQLKNQIDNLQEQLQQNKNQIFTLSKTKQFILRRNQQFQRQNSNLKKQIEMLHLQNEELKMNMNVNNISAVGESNSVADDNSSNEKSNNKKNKKDQLSQSQQIPQNIQNNSFMQSKLDVLTQEKEQWFQKYQSTKNQSLQKQSKIIKLTTQLNYATKTSKINEDKFNKIKEQVEALRKQNRQLKQSLTDKQNELEIQKIQNQNRINELQKQWMEFEEQVRKQNEQGGNPNLLSDRKSQKSMSVFTVRSNLNPNATKIQYLQTQIQFLNVRLKEAEAELQTQKMMEEKIINQYKSNIEQSKQQFKEKNNELISLQQQKGQLQSKLNNMHVQIKSLESVVQQQQQQIATASSNNEANNNASNSIANGNKKYTQLLDRIEQLENDLKQARQINTRLTDMESQLFQQINIKEQERVQLYQQIKNKQTKTIELQQYVEVLKEQLAAAIKQNNPTGNPFGSRFSTVSSPNNPDPNNPSYRRQSIKSQSSLKYSAHSNQKYILNSNKFSDHQGILDLELSEAGSEFYDIDHPQNNKKMTSSNIHHPNPNLNQSQYREQPSMISNISEMFDKEQFPYQKIQRISKTKIKRSDQLKLFQKTALYIKSLKTAIKQKDKRIKLLEKKIQSLKNSQLVRKELGFVSDDMLAETETNTFHISSDTFKDYESVQLQNRRGVSSNLRKYKQLQHDTKLVMEQNNMLAQQIESLEEQLLKAQDQQNNLVKIKDLYKQQIKKLIKKNQQQTKAFQEELKNQRKRLEESQSVHNLEVIKQLFIKMIQVSGSKFTNEEDKGISAKKREEKKKQMEEYVKVMSNILQLDAKMKQHLLKQFQNK